MTFSRSSSRNPDGPGDPPAPAPPAVSATATACPGRGRDGRVPSPPPASGASRRNQAAMRSQKPADSPGKCERGRATGPERRRAAIAGGSRFVCSMKNRRRPTLPGGCPPSTIGAEGLNDSVRNGKRCFPLAMATGKDERPRPPGPSKLHSATASIKKIRQALDPLVPVSYERYRSSRSGLSTWWSTRGLTPSRGWENSS